MGSVQSGHQSERGRQTAGVLCTCQRVSCVLGSGCHVYLAAGLVCTWRRVSCVPGRCCGRGESAVWPPVSARPVDSECHVYLAAGVMCTWQQVSCDLAAGVLCTWQVLRSWGERSLATSLSEAGRPRVSCVLVSGCCVYLSAGVLCTWQVLRS